MVLSPVILRISFLEFRTHFANLLRNTFNSVLLKYSRVSAVNDKRVRDFYRRLEQMNVSCK